MGLDLFKCSKWYLIAVDYYWRYFEIWELKGMSENEIIENCKNLFAKYGIPEIVRTDCGTQFSSTFQRFAKNYESGT